MQITENMPLGILLERKKIDHAWQEFAWHVFGVLPGARDDADWELISQDPDQTQTIYLAKTMLVQLYQRETEGYKNNLESGSPVIFVVLRLGVEKTDHDVEPFLITACPYEAADYLDSGEEIVESVTMPDGVRIWIENFVKEHHVEEVFKKRKLRPQTDGFAHKKTRGHA
jgi:hypothetical protein